MRILTTLLAVLTVTAFSTLAEAQDKPAPAASQPEAAGGMTYVLMKTSMGEIVLEREVENGV